MYICVCICIYIYILQYIIYYIRLYYEHIMVYHRVLHYHAVRRPRPAPLAPGIGGEGAQRERSISEMSSCFLGRDPGTLKSDIVSK